MMKANEIYIKKLIEDGSRPDGRDFEKYRDIKVETGVIENAEGSSRVTIGGTTVLVGVKMAVGEPFSDTPKEGVLIVSFFMNLSAFLHSLFSSIIPKRDMVRRTDIFIFSHTEPRGMMPSLIRSSGQKTRPWRMAEEV